MHHITRQSYATHTTRVSTRAPGVPIVWNIPRTFRGYVLSRNGYGNEISPMKREMGREMRYR
jgi:hypothetical protein